ncbi:DUF397 domain-containing protein [Streptomyces aureocirculatus]|uniref:DUF397 domain-containing protein n=1 Tax=Streptomyces aureocirculatus TaxID=67275 RepID=UPI0004C61A9D|nr:DUF397 domain-containing protein [Streptomyces aureocirculatus]
MSTPELSWHKSRYSSSGDGDCVEVALSWHKSSYSGSAGDDCVEVAPAWRKSSHSGSDGDDCVEVAPCPAAIHVRDSKRPGGPTLTLQPTPWSDFLRLVRAAP